MSSMDWCGTSREVSFLLYGLDGYHVLELVYFRFHAPRSKYKLQIKKTDFRDIQCLFLSWQPALKSKIVNLFSLLLR